jgi:hypothetical protein
MTDNKLTDEEVERVLDAAQKYVSAGLSMTHFQSHNVICELIAVLRIQLRAPVAQRDWCLACMQPATRCNCIAATSAPAEKGEPVAWYGVRHGLTFNPDLIDWWKANGLEVVALYASPQSPPAEPAAVAALMELVEAKKAADRANEVFMRWFDTEEEEKLAHSAALEATLSLERAWKSARAILAARPMPGVSPAQEKR